MQCNAEGIFLFDFLKKKISGFIDGLTKKEEEKPEDKEVQVIGNPMSRSVRTDHEHFGNVIPEDLRTNRRSQSAHERIAVHDITTVMEIPLHEPQPPPEKKEQEITTKEKSESPKKADHAPKIEKKAPLATEAKLKIEKKEIRSRKELEKPKEKKAEPPEHQSDRRVPTTSSGVFSHSVTTSQIVDAASCGVSDPQFVNEPKKIELPKPVPKAEAAEIEKPKERIKLGIVSAVKSIITREVEITEKDVKDMAENFELELLEADVDIAVAENIKSELLGKLVGAKINKDKLHSFVSQSIKETLVDVLSNEKAFDIVERIDASEKPVKIIFLGVNGSGKTTTIAKVAKLLQKNNRKIVFAAADTFRAAAIEQMCVHAERLGVKVIKREYGSDPTSVAYDAVNYAKAHGLDAVLIDTAGRQDTNISLINEMKKMNRVIQPDIIIYIGESIAGNAIIEQISAFNREIGVSAVILTKLDCDPKGGTMLSINKATGIPIIYVGIGQGYDDLEKFEPELIVRRIIE